MQKKKMLIKSYLWKKFAKKECLKTIVASLSQIGRFSIIGGIKPLIIILK